MKSRSSVVVDLTAAYGRLLIDLWAPPENKTIFSIYLH